MEIILKSIHRGVRFDIEAVFESGEPGGREVGIQVNRPTPAGNIGIDQIGTPCVHWSAPIMIEILSSPDSEIIDVKNIYEVPPPAIVNESLGPGR